MLAWHVTSLFSFSAHHTVNLTPHFPFPLLENSVKAASPSRHFHPFEPNFLFLARPKGKIFARFASSLAHSLTHSFLAPPFLPFIPFIPLSSPFTRSLLAKQTKPLAPSLLLFFFRVFLASSCLFSPIITKPQNDLFFSLFFTFFFNDFRYLVENCVNLRYVSSFVNIALESEGRSGIRFMLCPKLVNPQFPTPRILKARKEAEEKASGKKRTTGNIAEEDTAASQSDEETKEVKRRGSPSPKKKEKEDPKRRQRDRSASVSSVSD